MTSSSASQKDYRLVCLLVVRLVVNYSTRRRWIRISSRTFLVLGACHCTLVAASLPISAMKHSHEMYLQQRATTRRSGARDRDVLVARCVPPVRRYARHITPCKQQRIFIYYASRQHSAMQHNKIYNSKRKDRVKNTV